MELLKSGGKIRNVLAFAEEAVKKGVGKFRNVSAFAEGAVKQVFASLEMCWQSQKEGFPEGAVKKVLASLENCRHLLKELYKKCCKNF